MGKRLLFPTLLYEERLSPKGEARLNRELLEEALRFAQSDELGRRWSARHYSGGYTSYSSLAELHQMSSTFVKLREKIDLHVRRFARALDMDLREHPLEMTQCWVNVMRAQSHHSLHLHPLSSISGTYYVQVPRGSGGQLKFEDPRLACFMGSVPRRAEARLHNQRFVSLQPQAGQLVLFESWLRHEVEAPRSELPRVSVSFNYNWF